jgi:hypothetical protein
MKYPIKNFSPLLYYLNLDAQLGLPAILYHSQIIPTHVLPSEWQPIEYMQIDMTGIQFSYSLMKRRFMSNILAIN